MKSGLIHLKADVFTNPGCALVQFEGRVLLRYLNVKEYAELEKPVCQRCGQAAKGLLGLSRDGATFPV